MQQNMDKTSSSAPSSECNLLSLPKVTISSSSSDTNVLTHLEGDESDRDELTGQNVGIIRHKILKVGGLDYCSQSLSPPPPICTIVIEDSDGHIHCPTPSSLTDDEVFVL